MQLHTGRTDDSGDLKSEYLDRIESLVNLGGPDHIALNESSARDFFSFIDSASYSRRASLVLLDNGNIRAVWKPDGHGRVGIQFQGDGKVSFVIFKGRSLKDCFSRDFGADTMEGVRSRIREFGFDMELRG